IWRALRAAAGRRLVLAVYGRATNAPVTLDARRRYCRYVRNVVASFRSVHDVVVWNEPNSSTFWRPQFHADGASASAPAYERLLATCWDALHILRGRRVNVIAASAPRGNDNPRSRRPS